MMSPDETNPTALTTEPEALPQDLATSTAAKNWVTGHPLPNPETTVRLDKSPRRETDRYSPGVNVNWLDLVDSRATLPAEITLEQVQQFFREHAEEKYAAVIQGGRIVGLCSELSISRKLTVSRGLGYHVYAKTALERHLEGFFLMIPQGAPVREVLHRVMSRTEGFFDDIILTQTDGTYIGLIRTQTMMLLQHRISQQQVDALESLTLKLNDNNAELERARDQAMQAADIKSTFLANMSHEIRTPLNGILGMIKILMRTELAPLQRRYASTVLSSANALLTILNDILDFSKIEAGKMTMESVPFDLSDLVEESVQLLSERAREKQIQIFSWIDLKANTRVISDPSRLRQVILNLASNAVKFTEKGDVIVRIDQEAETESHVTLRVSVKDTGIGIAPEIRDRLFRPFEQGDRSTNRKFGGTGLGLAISKKIIDILGGSIGCDSIAGQGSTFFFHLELPKQAPLSPGNIRREDDLWGLRILIVDNSPIFANYLDQHMARWKVVSRTAQTADGALDIARTQADRGTFFDIVITDYNLQPMNGIELARQFQQDPRLSRSRFIILTSFDNELSPDALRESGVAGSLTKPLKPSEIYDKLTECVRLRPATPNTNINSTATSAEALPVSISPLPGLPSPAVKMEQALPRDPAILSTSLPQDPALSVSASSCPPLHLLLVEDSEVNREVALITLSAWGHTLETAENGRVALELLQTRRYDGILMDCQMPEVDGYEATQAIRNPASPVLDHQVPIIAMTANAMPGDREKCLQAGMNDYVGKPIEESELLQALLRIAHRKTTPATDPAKPAAVGQDPSLATSAVTNGATHVTTSEPVAPLPEPRPAPVHHEDDEPYFPARLIHLFVNETQCRLLELRESLQREDMPMIQRIAHTIKGTAGNFRAHRLYELMNELEKAVRTQNTSALWPILTEAEDSFQTVKKKYTASTTQPIGENSP